MGMTGATRSGSFVKVFRDPIKQKITWCNGCTELLNEMITIEKVEYSLAQLQAQSHSINSYYYYYAWSS
jgi:hypothetical protein